MAVVNYEKVQADFSVATAAACSAHYYWSYMHTCENVNGATKSHYDNNFRFVKNLFGPSC